MEGEEGEKKDVRRPMNAFLIFCKRHRSVVRQKNPDMDNRSVTRVLGDLWANLGEEKSTYTNLAKQVCLRLVVLIVQFFLYCILSGSYFHIILVEKLHTSDKSFSNFRGVNFFGSISVQSHNFLLSILTLFLHFFFEV